MITINFLYVHIVYCRNLKLTVKWLWRVTLRLYRKLHAWYTGPDRVMKKSAFNIDALDIPWDPSIGLVFSKHESLLPTVCTCLSVCRLLLIHHGSSFHLHHLVQKWQANNVSSTSIMARLRWYMWGDSTIRLDHACNLTSSRSPEMNAFKSGRMMEIALVFSCVYFVLFI